MNFIEYLHEFNMVTVAIRLVLALVFGGLIGLERGRQRRAAGLRTHILVCVGAALTVMVGFFAREVLGITNSDPLRVSAQVISGIGFLGVGTIMVKGRFQIVGLTTAAGLWVTAAIGIAVGAGFYEGAIFATFIILLAEMVFSKLEYFIVSSAKTFTLFVEYTDSAMLANIVDTLKKSQVYIIDLEVTKSSHDTGNLCAIFSVKVPRKQPHQSIMTEVSEIEGVVSVEEL